MTKQIENKPVRFLDSSTGQELRLNENPLWPSLHKKGIFEVEKAVQSKRISDPIIYTKTEKSVLSAIASDTPTLSTVRKYQGEEKVFKALEALIVQAAEYFNIGKKMSVPQIKMTAEVILMEFSHLNIAEIKLCFSFAMRGRYGVLFDRLDGGVICLWLREYNNEKLETAAAMNEKKHIEVKKEYGKGWNGDSQAKLKKMLEELREKRKARKELQKSTFQHASIRDFCEAHNLDFAKLINPMLEEWRTTYTQLDEQSRNELSETDFVEYMKKRYLAKINLESQMVKKK